VLNKLFTDQAQQPSKQTLLKLQDYTIKIWFGS
jgi:hypothetical protein